MPVFTTLMVLIVISSVTLGFISFNRVIAYNRKYHLPESKYTRLFGILNKEHILLVYLVFVAFHAFITIWFLITL